MRRLALIAIVLCAIGVSLRVAVTARYDAEQPERSAWILPPSGNGLMAQAGQRIIDRDGAVDAPARGLIVAAMVRVPAAGQPLALAGLEASARGDLPRATALMEAARDRAPRFALTRNWLLNEYVRTARYDEALAEAGVLMRLASQSRPQTYALIRAMAARPDTAPAVRRALAGRPDWAEPYAAWATSQSRPDPAT